MSGVAAWAARSIRHNHITDVGGQAIVTSLSDNRSLTSIQYAGRAPSTRADVGPACLTARAADWDG